MPSDEYQLGIDFGTSNTVAVLSAPHGQSRPVLFDGFELLPSAVCATHDGTLLVGRDALHAARFSPSGFEPHPKRVIDDGMVLLNDSEIPVVDLFTTVLKRVAAEARRILGTDPERVVLTCPAGWGTSRRTILSDAAKAAGLTAVTLVAEPVAAACYFVTVAGRRIPAGSCAVVYDFGAGTFDVSVVRATDDGFDVLAQHGLSDTGGLDIDAAIVSYLGAIYAGRDEELWSRLAYPVDSADRRAAHILWADVRTGKELLSRTSSTLIHVPLFEDDAILGRGQLERLASPIVDRTVRATRAVLRKAEVDIAGVADVFLVGGSSRMPLVNTLLHQSLGIAPTVIDHPELVVAAGSLHVSPCIAVITSTPSPIIVTHSSPVIDQPIRDPSPAEIRAESLSHQDQPSRVWPSSRIRRDKILLMGVLAVAVVIAGVVTALGSDRPTSAKQSLPTVAAESPHPTTPAPQASSTSINMSPSALDRSTVPAPSITSRKTPSSDVGPVSPAALKAMGMCPAGCRITGQVNIGHPQWGPTALVTALPLEGDTSHNACIVAVDSYGAMRWHHEGGPWHDIGFAKPARDTTGHVFIIYNPGRYDGIIILGLSEAGFDDFDTLPEPKEFLARFYSAGITDTNRDGEYEIDHALNDCEPSCANGTIHHRTYRWNGYTYVN